MVDPILTISRFKKLIEYDEITGIFTNKVNRGTVSKQGTTAGGVDISDNYYKIKIDNITYKGHHLAWYYIYEIWPEQEIDHINSNRCDNRIQNLRLCTHNQNCWNKEIVYNNTTGYRGC